MPRDYSYQVRIRKVTQESLAQLAQALGFIATTPGGFNGRPSPKDMLDRMMDLYRADPQSFEAALREMGLTSPELVE
jgi:hypothetical protein